MKKSFHLKTKQVVNNCIDFVGDLELGKWEVIIQPMGKTPPQERYWHMCLDEVAEQTGNDAEDLKDEIKKRVLGVKEYISSDGKLEKRAISSTGLDKQTYGKLIDATFTLAESMDVKLPDPSYFGYEGMLR